MCLGELVRAVSFKPSRSVNLRQAMGGISPELLGGLSQTERMPGPIAGQVDCVGVASSPMFEVTSIAHRGSTPARCLHSAAFLRAFPMSSISTSLRDHIREKAEDGSIPGLACPRDASEGERHSRGILALWARPAPATMENPKGIEAGRDGFGHSLIA